MINKEEKIIDVGEIIVFIMLLYEFLYYLNKISNPNITTKKIKEKTLVLIFVYIIVLIAYIGFKKIDMDKNTVLVIEMIIFIIGLIDINLA